MDKPNQDICKGHCSRGGKGNERRTFPSKVSKSELEQLYFNLLESNVELKKTVNSQTEKLKTLSTKLLRLSTSQQKHLCKVQSKCCINAHEVIEEQKHLIEELNQGNNKLLERNRSLNLKLCTKKQFSSTSPGRMSTKPRSPSVGAVSRKSLDGVESNTNIQVSGTVATARSQIGNNRSIDSDDKTVIENIVTVTEPGGNNEDNQFKTEVIELQQIIQNLQEELASVRAEYAVHLRTQEDSTARVQLEARRRFEEYALQRETLAAELRRAHSRSNSLATELSLEKKKVAELRAQVRAATLAQEVVLMLEDRLTQVTSKPGSDTPTIRPKSASNSVLKKSHLEDEESKLCNASCGASCTEAKCLLEIIEQLMKKIGSLQVEVDAMKISQNSKTAYPSIEKTHPQKVTNGVPSVRIFTETPSDKKQTEHSEPEADASPHVSPQSPTVDDCECDVSTDPPSRNARNKRANKTAARSSPRVIHEPEMYPNPVPVDNCECDVLSDPSQKTVTVIKTNESLYHPAPSPVSPAASPPSTNMNSDHVETKPRLNSATTKNSYKSKVHSAPPMVVDKCECNVTNDQDRSITTKDIYTAQPATRSRSPAHTYTADSDNDNPSDCICQSPHESAKHPSTSTDVLSWMSDGEKKRKDESPLRRKYLMFFNKPSRNKCNASQKNNSELTPDLGAKSQSMGTGEYNKKSIPFKTHTFQEENQTQCACEATDKMKTVSLYKNQLKACVCKSRSSNNRTRLVLAEKSTTSICSNKTYTVNGRPMKGSKSPSTCNTERDIASIPLRSDRDVDSSSYGEYHQMSDRVEPSSSTEPTSCSETVEMSAPLFSDGEIPTSNSRRASLNNRVRADPTIYETSYNVLTNIESTSSKVEEALRAITDELCKCRELLQTQQNSPPPPPPPQVPSAPHTPQQPTSQHSAVGSAQMNEDLPTRDVEPPADGAHELKKTAATPKIPDTPDNVCSFTVHLGSIILSDEAVVATMSRELFMQWRFYDREYTMTPVRAGRVVHFNFSTQYVVSVDVNFIEYLTHAPMVVLLCEMGKSTEPFAHCTVSLRGVLKHPERRVDMSSTLVAGRPPPHDLRPRTCGPHEVGVLDLWCLLQCGAQCAPLSGLTCAQACREGISASVRSDKTYHTPIVANISEERRHSHGPDKREFQKSLNTDERYYVDECGCPEESDVPADMDQIILEHNNQDTWSRIFPDRNVPSGFAARAGAAEHHHRCAAVMAAAAATQEGTLRRLAQCAVSQPESEHPSSSLHEAGTHKRISSGKSNSMSKKVVMIDQPGTGSNPSKEVDEQRRQSTLSAGVEAENDSVVITILWLALNEECAAMRDPRVTQLYVAYGFLGRSGADLETPLSMPKPSHYAEKVHYNFTKKFYLEECDHLALAHMARCRSPPESGATPPPPPPPGDAVAFVVVSEPAEDPLSLDDCEDIGHAYLFLGDLLSHSSADSYTEVVAVYPGPAASSSATSATVGRTSISAVNCPDDPDAGPTSNLPHQCNINATCGAACGVLAVRLDGLDAVRRSAARDGFTPSISSDDYL